VKTPSAPPYLLPPDDAVHAEEWRDLDGRQVGDRLEHWDPFTNLELVQVVSIDLDVVREACALGPDSAFAVTASGYSGHTRLGVEAPAVDLGLLDGRVRAPLTIFIEGATAGGRLDLLTRLVLRTPGTAPSPISPRRAGAVLWSQEARLALEGGAARFPVSVADFALIPRLPDTAAWALDWDPADLEIPVLGGLRLLVNSNTPRLIAAVRSGSTDAESAVIRAFVTFDVGKSLVHSALGNERFVDSPEEFEAGSVGRMLFELITACWAGTPVGTLRARAIHDPARLDAELQAHLGYVW
jgi:hypothetical protein